MRLRHLLVLTLVLAGALFAAPAFASDAVVVGGVAIPPEMIWGVVNTVLGFGFAAGYTWLHHRAARPGTPPPLAAALNKAAAAAARAQELVGENGVGAEAIAAAAENIFHAHHLATGAPHPADPRAAP